VKNANPVSRLRVALMAALAVAGLASCAKEKSAASAPVAPAATAKTWLDFFPIQVGGREVRMQLAVRPAEMQQGLMQRRDLGRDDGMIFVYDRPQPLSFWMRNTPTPLDIGFFTAAGVLDEVRQMHPFDDTAVPSRSAQVQFALEMNQGWYQAAGVKPGAQLDLKALAAALRARGMEPGKFGL
jgi:uncharacterized membrane protein (UPF0127 family)